MTSGRAKLRSIVFAHDNYFYSDGSGVYSSGAWFWERYLSIAERLVVVSRGGPPPPGEVGELDRVDHPRVEFRSVPNISSLKGRLTQRKAAASEVQDAVAEADAVVARLPSEIGLVAARMARRGGRPWAVEMAGCPWNALWNHGRWEGKLYAPVSRLETALAVRRAPFVLYVTREFLQGRYPATGHSVACSDVELPPPDEGVLARRIERIRRGITPVRIGIVGFLSVRYKGIDTALQALQRRRQDLPPFELALLGPGETEHWALLAERLGLADHVSFDGKVPGGAPVLEWLDSIDLYVHPTLEGGLPRALLEAMSRACPSLGSTAGGIPEVLSAAVLHDPGDVERLGEHLVVALNDAGWLEDQARRNFAVASSFTREKAEPVRERFWQEFAAYARG